MHAHAYRSVKLDSAAMLARTADDGAFIIPLARQRSGSPKGGAREGGGRRAHVRREGEKRQ